MTSLHKAARLIVVRELLAQYPNAGSRDLAELLGMTQRSAQRDLRDVGELERLLAEYRGRVFLPRGRGARRS